MRVAARGLIMLLLPLASAAASDPWPFPWPESRIAHYTARRATAPIVLDGRLDEADWNAAEKSPRFTDLVRGERASHDTRAAVHVDGTVNQNADRDRGWTVELAIPWTGLTQLARPDGRSLPPKDGDVWRMDFTRFNQYKEAPPSQDPGGWAWSPHGAWDSHIPEVFPYVRFSTQAVGDPARPVR